MSEPALMQEPPHYDSDLEETVIAHILARAIALPLVEEHLQPEHFGCGFYGQIFEAALFLKEQGVTPSPLVMKARLSGEVIKDIEARTGMAAIDFLQHIASKARPGQKIAEIAKLVADRALRRRVDAELEAARMRLSNYDQPVSDCLTDVVAAAGDVVAIEAREVGFKPMPEAVDAMLQQAEDAINGKEIPAVGTGLKMLDYITGGFQGGDLVIVAGRPGQGKTVLLSTVARSAAQKGHPVIFFEMEMKRVHIMHRLCADIDYEAYNPAYQKPLAFSRMRKGKYREGEWDRMYAAAQKLRELPIDIFDTAGMTVQEIAAHAQRFIDRSRTMGVVVIDYLQIIKAGDRYKGSKYGEMTEVSNELKRAAKRLGWPVVAGCQLSRAVESRNEKDKRPQLSDLRETGAIEQDADVVIGMHRPLYYVNQKRPQETASEEYLNWTAKRETVKHDLDLPVLKNRGGPDGFVKAFVDIGASVIRNHGTEAAGEAEDDPGQDLLL